MSKKVKVSSMTIELKDGRKIELGIDDARELYKNLEDLFGTKVFTSAAPVIIERDRWYPPYRPLWTCIDNSAGKYEAAWSNDSGSAVKLNCDSI